MKYLTLLLLLFPILTAHASHVIGGQIEYKPTGNTNEYLLNLTLYVDCQGVPASQSYNVDATNSCGITNTSTTVNLVSSIEISQLCPALFGSSACSGGNLFGARQNTYQGLITILPCTEWIFGFMTCNRNPSVNSLSQNSCFYIETKFNNLNFPNNSSPILTGLNQIPYVCTNTNIDLSLYITDPNSDSLKYSLVPALINSNSTIPYIAPFTYSAPIQNITIDSLTGELHFNSSMIGNFVVTVLIEEFSSNGILIGSMIHDFEIYIDVCTNTPPTSGPITSFNANGTGATYLNNQLTLLPGDEFCFDVVFTDIDVLDTLTLTSDIGTILTGATFTQTGTNPATANVCWVFQSNYSSSSFTILAEDNTCPIPGSISSVYTLNLPIPINLIIDTLTYCGASTLSNLITQTNAIVHWKDVNGVNLNVGVDITCNPCNNPNFLFTTDTIVYANLSGSNISYALFIDHTWSYPNFSDTIFVCYDQPTTFYSPNPNAPINLWNNSVSGLTYTAQYTTPQNLTFTTGDSACTISKTVYIDIHNLPIPIIQTTPTHLTTISPYSYYQWFYNNVPISGAISQNHTPLNNGDYTVEVIDSNGCINTSNIVTISSAGLIDINNALNIFRSNNLISINSDLKNISVEVYDLTGRLIVNQTRLNQTLTLNVPSENQIYLVKVYDEDLNLILIKKL